MSDMMKDARKETIDSSKSEDELNFEEFTEVLKMAIEKRMEEPVEVHFCTINKINRPEVKAMTILRSGENASPAIELVPYYEEFQSGVDMDSIAEKIVALYKKAGQSGKQDVSFYTDFEQARDHIVCRLMNYEMNHGLLETVPYLRYHDLALVYCYQMGNETLGMGSILVRNEHLEAWGIGPFQLHAVAVKNTKGKPYCLTPVCAVLGNILGFEKSQEEDEAAEEESLAYVLTNEEMCYGAVNIYFSDTLREVSSQIGGDYYVLPSSLHECMIVPVSEWTRNGAKKLQAIVHEINHNPEYMQVEQILGESVYRYYADTEKLEIVA